MHAIELDSSAFDRISLHDVCVYALVFQRLQHQGNLILDIDYIAEWRCRQNDKHSFLVVPATLTFLDIVDLQVHLDWGGQLHLRKRALWDNLLPLGRTDRG